MTARCIWQRPWRSARWSPATRCPSAYDCLLAQGWRGTKVDVSRQALVLAKAQPGDERVKPFELGAPRFRLANQPASSRWWEGREVCADLFDRTDTMRILAPACALVRARIERRVRRAAA